ncbi:MULTISPECIES: hypothetical protein [unclassified Bacillus cereus group]|uniref:hypothetical protein n=1 Tax=unclassified Bacillus cereus group TaxID=2750818 RepID=UPI0022E17A47|nr:MULTISPECIES: hypothetical protein [unclassified Bacillus cereus group]MDA2143481.1 hypothetical protein [Bacillus cereus group sp. Bc248]MDA2171416.1 hypothetical protein [Bacillus cereus group sp. Bc247]
MKNPEEFASAIVNLYKYDSKKFFINFINQDFIIDVISPKMNESHLDFLISSIEKAMDKNTENEFLTELLQIYAGYFSLFYNLESNSDRLIECRFLERTLVEQAQMLLSLLQDQHNMYQRENNKKSKSIHTSFEKYISQIDYNKFGGENQIKISAAENFDAIVEIINVIIPYLYYLKKDELEQNFEAPSKVSPYNDFPLEDILLISQQRWLLTDLWEKFKYGGWNISHEKTPETDEDIFIYAPGSEEFAKANFFGINRLNYQMNSLTTKSSIEEEEKIRTALEKTQEFLKTNFDIEKILNINIDTYNSIKIISEKVIEVASKFIDKYYYQIQHHGINLNKIFDFIEYMITISIIMDNRINYETSEIDGDFGFLTPIVRIDDLATAFSNIYNYKVEESKKIINVFIFGLPENRGKDLFSKPLVYCGNNKIIICPYLFTHLNIIKAIQEWLKQPGIELAQKGFEFEDEVIQSLKSNPYIKLNTNKIKFFASDGKNIEYDLIAEFDSNILLIEFKNMFYPYTDKEYSRSLNVVQEGVDQLNRREAIYNSDFSKIKNFCSFNLNADFKIVKILCTNIYHFTPTNIDNVHITDYSTLIKFFNNPSTNMTIFSKNEGRVERFLYNYDNAWKGSIPKLSDLELFLNNPPSIKIYKNKIKFQLKPIFKNKESDANLMYYDIYFTEDPYNLVDELIY